MPSMAAAKNPLPASDDVQVKGAFLRGYGAALKGLGLFDTVVARGSAQVRDGLQTPPTTSAWVDYGMVEEILRIVEAERGPIGVRKVGHDAVTAGVAPFMQIFVQSLLRLFGVSPATLFQYLNKAAGQTTRGVEYGYEATSEWSGVVTVTFPARATVEPAVWHSSAGGLEIVFETCGVIGTVQDPVFSGNSSQFRVSWRRK
jgi:hypothetical protein